MPPDAFEFGPFRLDAREHRLLRDGVPVPLPPKAFDLLVDLVRHAGRLREKADLMAALWPDTFVEEVNLAYTVSAIRRVLGDDRAHPHYIETVATKGYRFIAPVTCPGEKVDDETLAASRQVAPLDEETHDPYPGLRSFAEQDAAVFFGREEEVSALWGRIRANRLLAVIGPSGAGKTSFLRAGVVPQCPTGWAAVVCTPGTAPMRALGEAVAPALASDVDAVRQLVSFDDPQVAFTVLGRWRQAHQHALLVIDQFEELFTNNPPEVQARLARLVGRLASEADIHVVLSLRDDFLMRCHEHAALADVFSEITPLGPLTLANLRRALVEPARRLGYGFEDDALVDDMIDAITGARAALPMLAFAVARLWELRDRERRVLTRASYQRIGGVAGALAQHADATLERIGPAHQDLVRDLFRNLVTAQGTRAVIDRDELLSAFPASPDADVVLRALVDARLLTAYETKGDTADRASEQIEIVHESLLTAWPRLVRWRTQDEDAAQLRDQLKQAAHLWDQKGRSPDLLWSGAASREYALWRERYTGALTAVEEDFARAMAARAQRRRRLRRAVVASIVAALGIVAVAIGVAWRRAAAEARRAEASQLLALAELRLAEDPTEAALLAGASLEQHDTREAREFLMKVLWSGPLAFEIVADQGVSLPVFSPDGRRLAAGGLRPVLRLWTEGGAGALALPSPEPEGWFHLPFWASNDLLVAGPGGTVSTRAHVWSARLRKRLRTIEFGGRSAWQVAPGTLLVQTPATPGTSGPTRLRSWQLPDGAFVELGDVSPRDVGPTTLFAPDGRGLLFVRNREVWERALPVGNRADRLVEHLASAVAAPPWDPIPGDTFRVLLWDQSRDVRTWRVNGKGSSELSVVRMPGPPTTIMVPDSSGRWMTEPAPDDQQIRLWARSFWAEARPLALRRAGSWYSSNSSVHPSGDWVVASTSRFTRLTFWPVKQAYARVADGYDRVQRPLSFSPDGRWLATSWARGGVRLWPLPGTGVAAVRTIDLPEEEMLTWMTFDPAGRYLVVVGFGVGVLMIPLDGSAPKRLDGFSEDGAAFYVAVSPSGQRVAAASGWGPGEKTLVVWDLSSRSHRQYPLPPGTTGGGYQQGIQALVFSGETTLYSVGDGGLRRWNLDTGAQTLIVASRPGFHTVGRFSDDAGVALLWDWAPESNRADERPVRIVETRTGALRQVLGGEAGTERPMFPVLDPSGTVIASGSESGLVRVGRADDREPHVLAGHKGDVAHVAISPDLRWVASTGEDNTLRLWPMPDLSKPPLHTLPLDQLLAKLHSLTNLRAVRDPGSSTGWKIEVGPFPGWKNTPTW